MIIVRLLMGSELFLPFFVALSLKETIVNEAARQDDVYGASGFAREAVVRFLVIQPALSLERV